MNIEREERQKLYVIQKRLAEETEKTDINKKVLNELNEQERIQRKRIQLAIDAIDETVKLVDDDVEEEQTKTSCDGKLKL